MAGWKLSEAYVFDRRAVRYGVSGDGPKVVVVHGTPWSSFNLRHLIKALSQNFTVYYYDLIGYGQSDKSPGDVSLGIQNQVLAQLLDHWGLENPAIIGHDFGGTTVLRTHLISGRDFDKIVLIDPVAVSPWGSPFFSMSMRTRPLLRVFQTTFMSRSFVHMSKLLPSNPLITRHWI